MIISSVFSRGSLSKSRGTLWVVDSVVISVEVEVVTSVVEELVFGTSVVFNTWVELSTVWFLIKCWLVVVETVEFSNKIKLSFVVMTSAALKLFTKIKTKHNRAALFAVNIFVVVYE